jgi:hypothetical protein
VNFVLFVAIGALYSEQFSLAGIIGFLSVQRLSDWSGLRVWESPWERYLAVAPLFAIMLSIPLQRFCAPMLSKRGRVIAFITGLVCLFALPQAPLYSASARVFLVGSRYATKIPLKVTADVSVPGRLSLAHETSTASVPLLENEEISATISTESGSQQTAFDTYIRYPSEIAGSSAHVSGTLYLGGFEPVRVVRLSADTRHTSPELGRCGIRGGNAQIWCRPLFRVRT